ncbi:secretin N-terminal domain-containing protein [Crateriforma conspicua]|uniref:secretin N-terminal domain-containing protein n=1 Tax=Crateriforma conspicua TaxID=2527996 RepID=UPI00118B8F24|nr:secretin N-terminal domain-containing protein [Crateriforma conspicua]QDV63004.1 Bacterial type II/III secretion system short domain protein [Crateriforma conspicua]
MHHAIQTQTRPPRCHAPFLSAATRVFLAIAGLLLPLTLAAPFAVAQESDAPQEDVQESDVDQESAAESEKSWLDRFDVGGSNVTVTPAENRQRSLPSTDADGNPIVRFNFDRVPWRDVIRWIADEADLALQFDELPAGSFTYTDPNTFTHRQAIDRINLFLLPQGFTLVQSGRLLSAINLANPRSVQQLEALAPRVPADELADRPSYEVVRCFLALGDLEPDEALQELGPLNLMIDPAVFAKTKQLMVTDTVAKVTSAKSIIDSFTPDSLDNGTVMKTFALQNVDAEDILVVARPHLGLATGETIGIDVSLSSDPTGKFIFATGVEDKVKVIENLVESLDQPAATFGGSDSDVELRSHPVAGDAEMVYDVLQTMLAGETLRMSVDEKSDSIIALASPRLHDQIAATVGELQGSEAGFEVVPLQSVDPIFAISLIEEMLALDDFDDDDRDAETPPKIDADPGHMRLFVRGTPRQIEQIKQIVAGLDSGSPDTGDDVTILPLSGRAALESLETAAKFWREDNPVVLFPSGRGVKTSPTEKAIGDKVKPDAADQKSGVDANLTEEERTLISLTDGADEGGPRLLTDNQRSQAAMIRCQLISRGLLIQSDDSDALAEFKRHLQNIAGPAELAPSPPIIFYLSYAKANDALRMLAELLDGGEAAREGQAGTLVNGYVSGGGTYLGSIVTSREGTMTMMAGSITVVADPRLNRLIAQGTAGDLTLIESYLKIIDKDNSLTDNKTYGVTRVIEVVHADVNEVAAAIREAFADRIADSKASVAAAGGGGDPRREQDPRQRDNDDRGDSKRPSGKKPGASAPEIAEPKMTVAVHEPSQSLIITAPDQLFEQVQALVDRLDASSEQTVEVMTPSNAALQAILQPGFFGGTVTGGTSGNSSYRRSSSSSSSSSSRYRGSYSPGYNRGGR